MRREIAVTISPESDAKKETAQLALRVSGQNSAAVLDVNGAAILRVSRAVPDLAQDFLCVAACVYAADKAVARKNEEDKWTRHIAIQIPVEHVGAWSRVADEFSECIAFLTGDLWEISFRRAEKRLIQKRPRRRRVRCQHPSATAVSLFSGGLDSFIGAVDRLVDHPDERLLLVGHYDGHVSGPGMDQRTLIDFLLRRFGRRLEFAQVRVGLSAGGVDTNFRSRSLLFIALGCYFAEVLGKDTPVWIPENGPIAVNFPLTPARRGSCSTRTVHPHFVEKLNRILRGVGIGNPITNPYELKTKGEMVDGCRDQTLLTDACASTRSCAKMNRRQHWDNTGARSCGICIPCLFRRAALYKSGRDGEVYGNRIEDMRIASQIRGDVLALVTFLRSRFTDREIASRLLANGPLAIERLPLYADLVRRMSGEVLEWARAQGSKYIKGQVRGC